MNFPGSKLNFPVTSETRRLRLREALMIDGEAWHTTVRYETSEEPRVHRVQLPKCQVLDFGRFSEERSI